ncbi:MAG: hypothetical protein J6X45_03980, partial [Lachnospiraceae bacterium]|nr:hypothetical protein [Lachnospiraceae bacterium]
VVPGKRPVDLSEETISVVDDMRVRSIDVELGRGKEPNQEGFYSLWIRTMYINQDVPNDPFAKKYEEVPFDVDDPDDPFAGGV